MTLPGKFTSRVFSLALLALLLSGCGGRVEMFSKLVGSLFHQPKPAAPAQRLADPRVPGAQLVVTWVGHATVLIQIDDKFVLTDPVFTETVGMVSRRTVAPGLLPEALPEIDAVLISHMHFDHLSLGSLDLIEEKVSQIVVPFGGLAYVPGSHVPPVELDTWEAVELDGLRISAAPVEHPGWRFGGDRSWRTTAAAAYVIEYNGKTIYFGGDTARSTWMFRSVRRRFGDIDLALLPIAPIKPRDFMCRVHMDPAEALDAFVDLGARHMMPIHFDTFRNSLDEPGDATRLLRASMTEKKVDPARVAIFSHGQQRVFVP